MELLVTRLSPAVGEAAAAVGEICRAWCSAYSAPIRAAGVGVAVGVGAARPCLQACSSPTLAWAAGVVAPPYVQACSSPIRAAMEGEAGAVLCQLPPRRRLPSEPGRVPPWAPASWTRHSIRHHPCDLIQRALSEACRSARMRPQTASPTLPTLPTQSHQSSWPPARSTRPTGRSLDLDRDRSRLSRHTLCIQSLRAAVHRPGPPGTA